MEFDVYKFTHALSIAKEMKINTGVDYLCNVVYGTMNTVECIDLGLVDYDAFELEDIIAFLDDYIALFNLAKQQNLCFIGKIINRQPQQVLNTFI